MSRPSGGRGSLSRSLGAWARRAATYVAVGVVLGGCAPPAAALRPHDPPAPSPRLERARAEAEAYPDDWRAQLRAGSLLTREVLEGDPGQFEEAVTRLQRAHRLHPGTRHIPRQLARLLNLPLAQGDLRWADQQQALYEQLAQATAEAGAPSTERFIDECFLHASRAAAARHHRDPVGAVLRMRRLEHRMQRELAEHDDVDLHAMLGNYAQQVAGLTPVGRDRRIRLAIEHLRPVVERWDELSYGAQGLEYGVPGTRSVFTYWLAELSLADGRRDEAHALYRQVEGLVEGSDATPAMQMLAQSAAQRRALPAPPPVDHLLPLWPAGYDSCIACHAHEAVPHPAPSAPPALARR